MKTYFAPLTTIVVVHGYYSGGCRDFEFVPTPHTNGLLRAGRMLARMLDGRLHLLYEAESAGVPISSLAGQTLYFGMRLLNPSFSNITKPVLLDESLTPLYTNVAAVGALDPVQGVSLIAGLYTHTPLNATRPATLSLVDANANALDVRVLVDDTTSYDLRGFPTGQYLLIEDYGGGVVRTRKLLIDAELRDFGVWGVLALRIESASYQNAASFTLSFQARAETLRYYVVARNWAPGEFDELNVVDEGFAADERDQMMFDRKPAPFPNNGAFLDASLLGDSDAQIALFQTQAAIPRRDRGAKKVHLNRNATVLIEHLPSPGPERARADLIIHLSKP